MKVILAEKPSVARDIARELKATTRKDGYIEGNGFVVTWAFGHLVTLKEPDEYDTQYKRWDLAHLPIIPDKFLLKAAGDDGAKKQLKIVTDLFKKADELICATDAGREGELIFRYIQHWAKCTRKPFRRLWISSLTSEAIKKGFKNLKDGSEYDNLFKAARCRSEADWIVGMNGSRYFTLQFGGKQTLWSVGRVQTPILALIVNRDIEIEHFEPKDYWEVHTHYRETLFKHQGGKFFEQEKATNILEKITDQPLAIVGIIEKKEKTPAPLLYDLTDLQKDMNKRWGMTADDTLKAAQNLYEKKHLTYPRTDSRYLTADMKAGIPDLLKKISTVRPKDIEPLDLAKLNFSKRIINDAKVSDHHAVIPTDELPGSLPDQEAKIYEAVTTRFIAAFYPPCIKNVTTVSAESVEEPFRAIGRVLVDAGWQTLYPFMLKKKESDKDGDDAGDNQIMPSFEKGESGPHVPKLKTLKTTPPKPFTEASLLQAMETAGKMIDDDELKEALKNKGIGTPATRAQIIETLLHRKYIERQKKNLRATDSGRHLISIVQDERLKSPELTGEWETNLKSMEKGEYDPVKFMDDVVSHTKLLINQSQNGVTTSELGPCPLCKSPVIKGREHYGCSEWKAGCRFVLRRDSLGADIFPGIASELLRNRSTLKPVLMTIDGNPLFGTITLQDDGSLTYERMQVIKSGKGKDVLGPCPVCGGDIVAGDKAFGCSNWQNGCRFKIWKKIANKSVSKIVAKKILADGESEMIEGFKSRAGKSFSAKLKIVGDDIKFEFR